MTSQAHTVQKLCLFVTIEKHLFFWRTLIVIWKDYLQHGTGIACSWRKQEVVMIMYGGLCNFIDDLYWISFSNLFSRCLVSYSNMECLHILSGRLTMKTKKISHYLEFSELDLDLDLGLAILFAKNIYNSQFLRTSRIT